MQEEMIKRGAVSPLKDLPKGQAGDEQGLGLVEPEALPPEAKQAQGQPGDRDRGQSQGCAVGPYLSVLLLR